MEYAGDFVSQQNDPDPTVTPAYGTVVGISTSVQETGGIIQPRTVTNVAPDGVIDYYVVGGQRQTRWYGLPRDINGDRQILGWQAGRTNNQMVDVVPLRDVLKTFDAAVTRGAMERRLPNLPKGPAGDYAVSPGGMLDDQTYICAWSGDDRLYNKEGDNVAVNTAPATNLALINAAGVPVDAPPIPKMIRITLTLVDPKGGLNDGQTFQFVYNLP